VLRRQRFYDKAVENYKKALTNSDEQLDTQTQFQIAECLEEKGSRSEAATQYLDIAYTYSKNKNVSAKALLKAASIFTENGQTDQAMRAYEKIAQLDTEESVFAEEKLRQLSLNKANEIEALQLQTNN